MQCTKPIAEAGGGEFRGGREEAKGWALRRKPEERRVLLSGSSLRWLRFGERDQRSGREPVNGNLVCIFGPYCNRLGDVTPI